MDLSTHFTPVAPGTDFETIIKSAPIDFSNGNLMTSRSNNALPPSPSTGTISPTDVWSSLSRDQQPDASPPPVSPVEFLQQQQQVVFGAPNGNNIRLLPDSNNSNSNGSPAEIIRFEMNNKTKKIELDSEGKYIIRRNIFTAFTVVNGDIGERDTLHLRMIYAEATLSSKPVLVCAQHKHSQGNDMCPFIVERLEDGGESSLKSIQCGDSPGFFYQFHVKRGQKVNFKAFCNNSCHQRSRSNLTEAKAIILRAEVVGEDGVTKYWQDLRVQVMEQVRPKGGKQRKVNNIQGTNVFVPIKREKLDADEDLVVDEFRTMTDDVIRDKNVDLMKSFLSFAKLIYKN